jgi:hypothetical protein
VRFAIAKKLRIVIDADYMLAVQAIHPSRRAEIESSFDSAPTGEIESLVVAIRHLGPGCPGLLAHRSSGQRPRGTVVIPALGVPESFGVPKPAQVDQWMPLVACIFAGSLVGL